MFLTSLEMPELRHLKLDRLPVGRGARGCSPPAARSPTSRLSLAECALREKVCGPSSKHACFEPHCAGTTRQHRGQGSGEARQRERPAAAGLREPDPQPHPRVEPQPAW